MICDIAYAREVRKEYTKNKCFYLGWIDFRSMDTAYHNFKLQRMMTKKLPSRQFATGPDKDGKENPKSDGHFNYYIKFGKVEYEPRGNWLSIQVQIIDLENNKTLSSFQATVAPNKKISWHRTRKQNLSLCMDSLSDYIIYQTQVPARLKPQIGIVSLDNLDFRQIEYKKFGYANAIDGKEANEIYMNAAKKQFTDCILTGPGSSAKGDADRENYNVKLSPVYVGNNAESISIKIDVYDAKAGKFLSSYFFNSKYHGLTEYKEPAKKKDDGKKPKEEKKLSDKEKKQKALDDAKETKRQEKIKADIGKKRQIGLKNRLNDFSKIIVNKIRSQINEQLKLKSKQKSFEKNEEDNTKADKKK